MILVDSIYINNGGGKVLLDYLVNKLESSKVNVFYLFDERCINDFEDIPNDRKFYLKASLAIRKKFYLNNKNKFSSVLCFGNLAPSIKLNVPVYTYFHQPMYLNIPKQFSLRQKILFRIKTLIFSKLLNNTDFVVVQTDFMKQGLVQKFKSLTCNKILKYPFYPDEDFVDLKNEREEDSFIFVSAGTPHKNHLKLISAFCKFYDQHKKGKLYLTVNPEIFIELSKTIQEKNNLGYPITNLGFIKRTFLIEYYNRVKFHIFPSLEESFGLGLVEAVDCGCDIIGADLPYTYAVCKPSIQFDPLDEKSIYNAIEAATRVKLEKSEKVIENKVEELIGLLTKHNTMHD